MKRVRYLSDLANRYSEEIENRKMFFEDLRILRHYKYSHQIHRFLKAMDTE